MRSNINTSSATNIIGILKSTPNEFIKDNKQIIEAPNNILIKIYKSGLLSVILKIIHKIAVITNSE